MVVDFTTTRLEQVGQDRVRVSGIGGQPRTPTLKASIAVTEGFFGEDMFFYAGLGALARAELALNLDNYGKALSSALLSFGVDVPDQLQPQLVGPVQ